MTKEHSGSAAARAPGTALLIIDMQPWYLATQMKSVRSRMVSEQRNLLLLCKAHDIPAIALELDDDESTIPELLLPLHLVPRMRRIRKGKGDAFAQTCLDELLREWRVSDLLLTGINASACVLETARSAAKLRYRVHTTETLAADEYCSRMLQDGHDWYTANDCLREGNASSLLGIH